MKTLIGDKRTFAVEIGEFASDNHTLRQVDLWAADRWWTCDDNHAYIPPFLASVQWTLERLQSGQDLATPFPGIPAVQTHQRLLAADDGSHQRFWFADWGPTTDNLLALMFREEARISITFEFWREAHHRPEELGVVFVADLAEDELIRVLEETIAALS